jgi:hypothetical protein
MDHSVIRDRIILVTRSPQDRWGVEHLFIGMMMLIALRELVMAVTG